MRLPPRHSPLGASLERDLTCLADGTLDSSRAERLGRLLVGWPELQVHLREQRRAVAAVREAGRIERAPVSVRVRHQALARHQSVARRSRRPGLTLPLGVVGAGAVLGMLAALSGGQATLTVAQAATIAVRPATAAVGEPRDHAAPLPGVRAAGLTFPYWEDRFGWHATGTRVDRLDGRVLTTVFYRRGASDIAYTIVTGPVLAQGARASTTNRGGTALTTSRSAGRTVVTWVRRGHTCVLSGRGVPQGALQSLAAWHHGDKSY